MSSAISRNRCFSVAIPAKDEQETLGAALKALDRAAENYEGDVAIYVLANNCCDQTLAVLQHARLRKARLSWAGTSLLPPYQHAGWARRLALDGAAELLNYPDDVLASTDADTVVAPNWFTRTAHHLDNGVDAVAGQALTRRSDRRALVEKAQRRLNLLNRYHIALNWLRADMAVSQHDPWPRHFYEGGASLAVTLGMYRATGGAPTPPVGEDRALFDAVRQAGGKVRHPLDVRVFTSGRTQGRAAGGMADTLARWMTQDDNEAIHETYVIPAALNPAMAVDDDRLTFANLPTALAALQAIIKARGSTSAPQVKPILFAALGANDCNRALKIAPQLIDRSVA